MSDTSLIDEALDSLKKDLTGDHGSIAAQSGIPFAVLRYAPSEEYRFRRRVRLFAHSLEQDYQKRVAFVSLSRLVWNAIKQTDGVDYLFETELKAGGVTAAQNDLGGRLIPGEHYAIANQIMDQLNDLKPKADVVFLVRTGGVAPYIYRSSTLLHELHELNLKTPTILCYPGSSVVGTDLRFYDLPAEEGLGAYNYRVKIYGTH
jgi:hypothetical protein